MLENELMPIQLCPQMDFKPLNLLNSARFFENVNKHQFNLQKI